MRAPLFWNTTHWISDILQPIARVVAYISKRRFESVAPIKVDIPVICVGNLVAGGAGKTPVAIALHALLRDRFSSLWFISRGYGGSRHGPLQVDTRIHRFEEVGDEPLLLAAYAPTVIARRRIDGANTAQALGAKAVILDDGFQNPTLYKDCSFVVVDGGYGFGNGRLIPAGPLREPIESGLKRASAVILVDADAHSLIPKLSEHVPVFRATTSLLAPDLKPGQPVVAFAGIGRPEKFHASLRSLGVDVVKMIGFPDHHPYSKEDMDAIFAKGKTLGATLVTTEKDALRLPEYFRDNVTVVKLALAFEDPAALKHFILARLPNG